jgi:nucleotide-binding universal stress UspA family protein
MILYVADELSTGRLPDGSTLVSEKNLLLRRERGVPISEDQWYGMGLMEDATSGVSVVHHGGDLAGFHSDIIAIPSADVGAVILTNADHGAIMRRPFLRRLLEILYDGRPEAVADAAAAAERTEAARRVERAHLIIPAPATQADRLAGFYQNPALGPLTLERRGADLVMVGTAWRTPLGTRKNDDGTTTLVTLDPQLHFEFVVGESGGKRTLTARDGQHVYVFEARS